MLNSLVDSRDIRFVLFDLLETDKITTKYSEFSEQDREIYENVLELAERLAIEQIYPASSEGDKVGCKYDSSSKVVKIPECYREPLDAYHEAGFIGIANDPAIGGMGMPYELDMACSEYFLAASVPMLMYPGLTHGAMHLIESFGTVELKEIFIEKMISGKWGGTMCLTEANAGTDVGLLKSKAKKNEDGTYSITGQNIFISSGDNDYYENIIHLKLARIEGHPEGTKGLSLFIVPKYRINTDGSKGEFNDVTCAGIEHKMGIHGSSTCTLSFGDNGNCIGYLLGEEQQGMRLMFKMMNEARLGVGLMGLALSSTAYLHSVTYAKNRLQGKHITEMLNPEAEAVTISKHPDVKRMLLWMKSHVDGMRILSYFLAQQATIEKLSDGEEKKEAHAIGELLRPVLKAGNTDISVLVTSEAVQVYGGYGYCADYPVEQLMRDSKITTIYEGTNGIQSADFIMRKLLMNPEQYNYNVFQKRIIEIIEKARGIVDNKYISIVERGLQRLNEVIDILKKQMSEGKFMHLFMKATPLQQAMHMLCLAWCHLWALTAAKPKMKELVGDAKGQERGSILEENSEAAFYSGRVLSAQFYIGSEFPKFFGRIESLLIDETAVIKATDAIFTGALDE